MPKTSGKIQEKSTQKEKNKLTPQKKNSSKNKLMTIKEEVSSHKEQTTENLESHGQTYENQNMSRPHDLQENNISDLEKNYIKNENIKESPLLEASKKKSLNLYKNGRPPQKTDEDFQNKLSERGGREQRRYSAEQPILNEPEKVSAQLGEPDLQIQISDDTLIHFESELKKYKPGLSKQYILRWCQATPSHLNYYKSHWSANCWLAKPLMSIPYNAIQSIRRVEVKFPIKKKPTGKKQPEIYQFEIFLKKDVDVSLLSKSIDYSAYETRYMQLIKQRPNSRGASYSVMMPRSVYGSVANIRDPLSSEQNLKGRPPAYSFLEPTSSAQRPMSINASTSHLSPEKSGVVSGHLMKTPSTLYKTKEYSQEKFMMSNELSTSGEKRVEFIEHDNLMFVNKKQIERYEAFKQKYGKELQNVVMSEEVNIKNPSAWIPTLASIFFRSETI